MHVEPIIPFHLRSRIAVILFVAVATIYPTPTAGQAGPLAACCVADQCTDGVNQLDCDALGGTFLAPPQKAPLVPDCSTSPCATGSCCAGPGECFDNALGQPVDKAYCDSNFGTYHGGVRCKGGTCEGAPAESCSYDLDCPGSTGPCLGTDQQRAQPTPCPLCSLQGESNCQAFDGYSYLFVPSDRHLGSSGILAADDFRLNGSVLDHACVWGLYIDSDSNALTSDCGPSVNADHFLVRVYSNDPVTQRSPSMLVGEITATSQRSEVLPGRLMTYPAGIYTYDLVLDTPITGLTPHEVYWLEVSNDVTDALPTCSWFWKQKTRPPTSYSYQRIPYQSPPGYPVPGDNVFCLNAAFTPIPTEVLVGACCTCDETCTDETLSHCQNKNGIWDINELTCDGAVCPGVPANDNCVDGPPVLTAGSYIASNYCATTDGFGPIPTDYFPTKGDQIESDLWYTFISPSTCDLTVNECQTGNQFDSMLAVYMNCPPGSPAGCDRTACPPCPLDQETSWATLAGYGQDESCTSFFVGGAGYWQASQQIGRNALAGECFLIRVGGYASSQGAATLDIDCAVCRGPGCAPAPIIAQTNDACTSPGIPFNCCTGTGIGNCDKVRFLSFTPPTDSIGQTALRIKLVSLHHVNPPYAGGTTIPFTAFEAQSVYVGPPASYDESTAVQTPLKSAATQCQPHYQDWSTVGLVHVRGSAIVPSSTYQVEYLAPACMGVEGSPACQSGGANVSVAATMKTARWGDVETPFNPPSSTNQPDLADVGSMLNKFRSAAGAPIKPRVIIQSNDQFGNISGAAMSADFSFTHIASCVDAFRGQHYPAKMGKCATANIACTLNSECGADGPCSLYCP